MTDRDGDVPGKDATTHGRREGVVDDTGQGSRNRTCSLRAPSAALYQIEPYPDEMCGDLFPCR